MRRGKSTVVGLVGEVSDGLLAELGRLPNVAVVRADGDGLDAAAGALATASGLEVTYALVAADPLAGVAEQWRARWDVGAGPDAFEEVAGVAIAAWRAGRFELPDYYVVVAAEPAPEESRAAPHRFDLYLGVLHAERPARVVAVAPAASGARETAARVAHALGSLPQGPWWPPLDDLVASARTFFPGRAA
jgi:hypothetical protein